MFCMIIRNALSPDSVLKPRRSAKVTQGDAEEVYMQENIILHIVSILRYLSLTKVTFEI